METEGRSQVVEGDEKIAPQADTQPLEAMETEKAEADAKETNGNHSPRKRKRGHLKLEGNSEEVEVDAGMVKRSSLRARLGTSPMHASSSDLNGDLEVDRPGENFDVKHPRYDNDAYQAPVPELLTEEQRKGATESQSQEGGSAFVSLNRMVIRDAQLKIDDRMVWGGGSAMEAKSLTDAEIDNFLLFCRRLTREIPPQGSHFNQRKVAMTDQNSENTELGGSESSGKRGRRNSQKELAKYSDELSLRPLESDELALEYLHYCNYHIPYAKFLLLSTHGAGWEGEMLGRVDRSRKTQVGGKPFEQAFLTAFGEFEADEEEDPDFSFSAEGEDVNSPLRKWVSLTRTVLSGKVTTNIAPTRQQLLTLLQSGSKFRKEKADPKLAHQSKELLGQLEKKVDVVDEWVANAHDAASLVKPGLHWTLDEIKALVQSVPNGVRLAEEAQLKRFYEDCVSLQGDALQCLEKTTHLRVFRNVIERSTRLPLDLPELRAIKEKISAAEQFAKKIRTMIPCSEMWAKQSTLSKRGVGMQSIYKSEDWTPQKIGTLRQVEAEITASKITFREFEVLQHYIGLANDWIKREETSISEGVDVKYLLDLVKEVDLIPVDLSEEKGFVDEQLKRARECIARLKTAVPKQSKTRGTVEVTKMELETLRALKDEAVLVGASPTEIQEIEVIINKADEWKSQVDGVLADIDAVDTETIEMLLEQVIDIPVIMIEEDVLRIQLRCKECCQEARKALEAKVELEALIKIHNKLQGMRKELQALPFQAVAKSLETHKCDSLLRDVINKAQKWMTQVNFLCRYDAGDSAALSGRGHRKKKKKQPKPKKKNSNELFAAYERASFQEFASLYEKGSHLAVDVTKALDRMKELEESLVPIRVELRAFLNKGSQLELEQLETQPQEALKPDNPPSLNPAKSPVEMEEDQNNVSTNGNQPSSLVKSEQMDGGDDDDEAQDANGDALDEDLNEPFTLARLEERLENCRQFSIITQEEVAFKTAVNRTKHWIEQVVEVCPSLQVWPGIASSSLESTDINVSSMEDSVNVEHVETLIEESSGLFVNVEEPLRVLKATLDVTRLWVERAKSILMLFDSYSAKVLQEGSSNLQLVLPKLEKDLDDSVSVASSVDQEEFGSGKRSKRAYLKKKKAEIASDSDMFDLSLELAPSAKEKSYWSEMPISLNLDTLELFGKDLSASEAVPMDVFDVKKYRSVDASIEERTAALNEALSEDLVCIANGAKSLAADLYGEDKSAVARTLPMVKKTLWIAEAAAWIDVAVQIIRFSIRVPMDNLRSLIGQGLCLLEGEYPQIDESTSSPLEEIIKTSLTSLEARGVIISPLYHSILPVGQSGVSMKDVEGLMKKHEDGSGGRPFPGSLGWCVTTLVKKLQVVGRNSLAWGIVAKKMLSQTKSMDNLLSLIVFLDKKYRKKLFAESEQEIAIIQEMEKMYEWMRKVHFALAKRDVEGAKHLTLEELEKLVVEAGKLKVTPAEIKDVKQVVKAARNWINKVKKSGIEKGEASRETLKGILEDAMSISADLSEHTTLLEEATKVYCLCQRTFKDPMVECAHCHGWFHCSCVTLPITLAQSDLEYTCPLCSLSRTESVLFGLASGAVARSRLAREFLESKRDCPYTTSYLHLLHLHFSNLEKFFAISVECRNDGSKVEKAEEFLENQDTSNLVFVNSADGSHLYNFLAFRTWALKARKLFDSRLPLFHEIYAFTLKTIASPRVVRESSFASFLFSLEKACTRWNMKAKNAFNSDISISSASVIEMAREIIDSASQFPVLLPLERALAACVEDGANRYCICRGFNDGEFMINCDGCAEWFHGRCVNVPPSVGDSDMNYLCPQCSARRGKQYMFPG